MTMYALLADSPAPRSATAMTMSALLADSPATHSTLSLRVARHLSAHSDAMYALLADSPAPSDDNIRSPGGQPRQPVRPQR